MSSAILFLLTFIFIFVVYTLYFLKKKSRQKLMTVNQYAYLVHRYQIDDSKANQKKIIFLVAFSNAFIIANTTMIINFFDVSIWWQMIIAFLILFILIFTVYGIIGFFIKKKK